MTLNTAQRQAVAWLGIGAIALLLVWLLAPVLVPFLLAAVLAYALHPAVEKLVARKVPRLLAVLLIETGVILLLLGLLLLMVPILSKEIPLLREQIPVLAARLNEHVVPWLAQYDIHVSLDIESIKAFVVKYLNANFEDWLSAALSSARIGGSFVLAVALVKREPSLWKNCTGIHSPTVTRSSFPSPS